MTKKESITLKHIGYRCKGFATINLHGAGQGNIQMDDWDTEKGDRDSILKGVNDGQFGCESIEKAIVNVFNLYEHNVTIFSSTVEFSAEELKNAKRGI